MNLREYIYKRNGRPLGARGSLINMLKRSLTASNPAEFWQYWNPIFGYYLGTLVFRPAKKILPAGLALLITFLVNGLIHDLVIISVRGSYYWFFTPWFFLLALGVLAAKYFQIDNSGKSLLFRVIFNLTYLSLTLIIMLMVKHFLEFP